MKHGFIPFTALLLTLLGALNAADSPEGTLSSGEYFIRKSWSQEQDFPRPYHVHVPTNPDRRKLPVFIFLQGKADTTVPYASVVAFESAMKKVDRPCKLVGYDGADHGFFNRGEGYTRTLAEADAFLVDLGWIRK